MRVLKISLLIFLAVFVVGIAHTQTPTVEPLTFRGIPFGASQADIVEVMGEPDEVLTEDDIGMAGDLGLYYAELPVAGYKAQATLELEADSFIGASYRFLIDRRTLATDVVDPTQHVNGYTDLLDKLTSIYGEPVESDPLESARGYTGLAARQLQDRQFRSDWEVAGGGVVLFLSYDSYRWNLDIVYISPEMWDRMQQVNTEGL